MKNSGYHVISASTPSVNVGRMRRSRLLTDIVCPLVARPDRIEREGQPDEDHDHASRGRQPEIAVLERGAVDVPPWRLGRRARPTLGQDELRLDRLDAAENDQHG